MKMANPNSNRDHQSLNALSFASAVLGIISSTGGQILSAYKLTVDWNVGHPSSSQTTLHLLLIAPGIFFAIAGVSLGCYICHIYPQRRRFAIFGITTGTLSLILTLLNFPGDLAIDYWMEPVPGEY